MNDIQDIGIMLTMILQISGATAPTTAMTTAPGVFTSVETCTVAGKEWAAKATAGERRKFDCSKGPF